MQVCVFDNLLSQKLSEFLMHIIQSFVLFVKYVKSNFRSFWYMYLQFKRVSLCLTLVLNLLICSPEFVHKFKEKLSKMQSLLSIKCNHDIYKIEIKSEMNAQI